MHSPGKATSCDLKSALGSTVLIGDDWTLVAVRPVGFYSPEPTTTLAPSSTSFATSLVTSSIQTSIVTTSASTLIASTQVSSTAFSTLASSTTAIVSTTSEPATASVSSVPLTTVTSVSVKQTSTAAKTTTRLTPSIRPLSPMQLRIRQIAAKLPVPKPRVLQPYVGGLSPFLNKMKLTKKALVNKAKLTSLTANVKPKNPFTFLKKLFKRRDTDDGSNESNLVGLVFSPTGYTVSNFSDPINFTSSNVTATITAEDSFSVVFEFPANYSDVWYVFDVTDDGILSVIAMLDTDTISAIQFNGKLTGSGRRDDASAGVSLNVVIIEIPEGNPDDASTATVASTSAIVTGTFTNLVTQNTYAAQPSVIKYGEQTTVANAGYGVKTTAQSPVKVYAGSALKNSLVGGLLVFSMGLLL